MKPQLQLKTKSKTSMKKIFYGGASAAVFTLLSIFAASSCNSDDEYYESSNYTLAKKRVTRATEGVTQPKPSVMYNGGDQDVEYPWNGDRLNFHFSWGSGSSYDTNISVSYNGCGNVNGYQIFYDELGIERHEPNIVINSVEFSAPARISNNAIIQPIVILYTQKQIVTDDEGKAKRDMYGNTVYTQSRILRSTSELRLDISSYREK